MADDNRFEAKIDDFNLEMENIEDTIEVSIAKYEFPFRHGALLENMGQKARVIKVRCYWYEETYETHKDFVKHLEKKELFELLHPKYGLIKGSIDSISIRHDDRKKTAEVDLAFTEGLITEAQAQPKYVNKGAVDWGAEDTFAAGQTELIEELETDVREILGAEAMEILSAVLDPVQPLIDQFNDISVQARGYVKAADLFVKGLAGTLTTITNPAEFPPGDDNIPEHPGRHSHRYPGTDAGAIFDPLRHPSHLTHQVLKQPGGQFRFPVR